MGTGEVIGAMSYSLGIVAFVLIASETCLRVRIVISRSELTLRNLMN
jgi:hypothetical protein